MTRDGRDVGIFTMTRDGYEWDCFDAERERFEDAVREIIEDLSGPKASVVRIGNASQPVVLEPGDPRWFDLVLARLQNKGYEHVVRADDL